MLLIFQWYFISIIKLIILLIWAQGISAIQNISGKILNKPNNHKMLSLRSNERYIYNILLKIWPTNLLNTSRLLPSIVTIRKNNLNDTRLQLNIMENSTIQRVHSRNTMQANIIKLSKILTVQLQHNRHWRSKSMCSLPEDIWRKLHQQPRYSIHRIGGFLLARHLGFLNQNPSQSSKNTYYPIRYQNKSLYSSIS